MGLSTQILNEPTDRAGTAAVTDTLAAYWGPRPESPAAAARLVATALQIVSPGATWFETGSARPRPENAVDQASLESLLVRGVNRRDTDKSVIPELGFSLDVWDGRADIGTKVSFLVGSTSSVPGTGNSVVAKVAEHLRARAAEMFPAMVELTEPDRAIWTTRDYRRSQPTVDGSAYVGWQTYLTEPFASRARVGLDGVTMRELANGVWITTGDEPGQPSRTLAAQIAARL